MVTNCKNCGLPIFHGAAGYAGAQCRCGFSAKPNYDHNALTELLKERDQLKADSEVVADLVESLLAENLRLKAENEVLTLRVMAGERQELAALKSAPVVMPERKYDGSDWFFGWNACLDEFAHLNGGAKS